MIPDSWRILITGVTSIHCWPIYKRLIKMIPEKNIIALRSPKMKIPEGKNVYSFCITDKNALDKLQKEFRPTHILHGAGVCDLDVCEERPEWAYNLNVTGSHLISKIFSDTSYIMYFSSDLVFSGSNPPTDGYNEEHEPDPVSVAGKTILGAEKEIAKSKNFSVIRLGLPMGDSITGDKGVFDWPKSRFAKNKPVTLFYDEIRSCIDSEELAEKVINLLSIEAKGIYHLGGQVPMSLYEVGKIIIKKGDFNPSLLNTISRFEEKNGPPRVGNISLNSQKSAQLLQRNHQI